MLIPFLLFLFIPSLLALIAVLFLLLYIALYRAPSTTRRTSLGRSAAVIVLGDVGRSPRMCYHVESLADQGWKVSLVGYGGSKLPSSIQRSSVKFHQLSEVPPWISKLPRVAFILVAPFKLLWQSVGLFFKVTMTIQPPPEVIFVQTPPALPTLFIVRICSLLLSSRVVIDWHNLGYTILSLRLGKTSPLVSLARTLERLSGRTAFAHLFVTHAMKRHLEKEWRLQGHKAVLHDRPPKHFKKASTAEAHALWTTLAPKLQPSLQDFWSPSPDGRAAAGSHSSTPFTRVTSSSPPKAVWRAERPALAVSSTSWTADEDFGLLLRAAQLYEKRAREVNAGRMMSEPYPSGRQPINWRASFTSGPTNLEDSSALYESPRNSLEQNQSAGGAHATVSNLSPPRSHSPVPGYVDPSMPALGSKAAHRNRRPSLQSMRSCTLPNIPAQRLPKLLIVVTGKGDLRAKYEREIAQLEKQEAWEYVRIRTAWLENWEYPLLLGSADVGISLHTSSSGLDLPMKVVDMLGCHLPVLALDFSCLDELIQHSRNGLTFSDEGQLCDGFESLLADFPRYGSLTGDSQNWLVRGGGLKDPFAYAGKQGEPGSQCDSVASSSQDAPLTRQSLEATSALDEVDERKRLSRTSLDFSKGGLPTSTSFGSTSASTSAHASAAPSPSASLWGLGEHLATASQIPPRPVTPTPTFTLLASPLLGPSAEFPDSSDSVARDGQQAASSQTQNTWTSNWKGTVRPLLRLADEEDAKAEGLSLSDEEDEDDPDSQSQEDELSRLLGSGERDAANDLPSFPSLTMPKRRRRRLGADGKPLRVRGGSVQGLLWSEDFAHLRAGAGALAGSDDDDDDDELERDLGFLGSLGIVSPRAGDRPRRRDQARRSGSIPSAAQAKLLGMAMSPLKKEKASKKSSPSSPSSSGSSSPLLQEEAEAVPGTGHARRMASTTTTTADSIPLHVSSHDSDARRGHLRQRTTATAATAVMYGGSNGAGAGAGGAGAGIPDIWVSQVEGDSSGGR